VDINPGALRQARVAAGLSLAQVGGHDLTRQAVHLIETGKVRPSMRSLRVLAERLQVPVARLLAPADHGAQFDESGIADLDQLCRRHEYALAVERAQEILEGCDAPELIAGAHHFMGEALSYLGRPREALEHLARARELLESLDDDQGRIAETMELEATALHLCEDPRAIDVAREALRRYRALDGRRPEVESKLLQRLGTILISKMDYEAARAHYEEALQVADGVRDLVRLARLYHGLALCHQSAGDARTGAELLLKALTLYEAEERLAGPGGRMDLARAENDLGMLLMRRGELARADAYLMSALGRFGQGRVEQVRTHVLLSLGELRQAQGHLDESIEIVRQAIDLAERLGQTSPLAFGHQQLGELHAALGDRAQAASSFERALSILQEAGLDRLHANCAEARDAALGDPAQAKAARSTA
jgi:tetratricopeptide (TPR) repeat protein